MLQAPAALLASLALAGVTRYTASLSSVARYYTDVEAVQPLSATALEVEPSLGLEHDERTSTLRVAYFPRLVAIAASPPPRFLNQASLSLALRPDPTLRLTGSASGCYGTNDFRVQYALACGAPVLAPGAVAGPQPIPLVSTIRYMSASGALGFESRPAARIAVSGTLSYLVQGGADAPTRALLPLQRGPSFLAALEWAAGRNDALATSISGSYYAFLREALAPGANEPATSAWISQVVEVWQHVVGRGGRLRLGLGLGVAGDANDLPRLVLRTASAVGEVGLQQAFGRREDERPPPREVDTPGAAPGPWAMEIVLNAGARVAPFVDFTSGLAYERADAFAGLGWPLDRDWRLDASFAAGVALDGAQRGQATATAQLSSTWTAARWVRLSTGLNGLWQRAGADVATSSVRQVGFFLGATFTQVGQL
jgi:hypothetical protein